MSANADHSELTNQHGKDKWKRTNCIINKSILIRIQWTKSTSNQHVNAKIHFFINIVFGDLASPSIILPGIGKLESECATQSLNDNSFNY